MAEVSYTEIPRVKGSPVLRFYASYKGKLVGQIWTYNNPEDPNENPASPWYWRCADCYGFSTGLNAKDAVMAAVESMVSFFYPDTEERASHG